MHVVTSLILRQMRAPFLVLIVGYGITMLGLVLTPGIDANGNPWRMSFFDAFYFVSFTATTIGFGEIPYALSAAQRMWALITIYVTVTSWFYALGKILSLIQDPTFKSAMRHATYAKNIKDIRENFILVCGFGETGAALTHALTEHNIRTVVLEQDEQKVKTIPLMEFPVYVPSIRGDARDPEQLIMAGLAHTKCSGVIAVTASDETNLKVAISAKLLNPDIRVICRSELEEHESNMLSFGTDYIINPFDTFADIFGMAMHSPSLHLLYDWLTGRPATLLTSPVYVTQGHWIICGYGRFGQGLHQHLIKHNIPVTVIDPSEKRRDDFLARQENRDSDFIIGTGFDEHTLRLAGVEQAAGIISGSNNDSNNLSIVMTARQINPEIFVVARQNKKNNSRLFAATHANLIMQPSDIIARKIRTLLTVPLMVPFLNKARHQDSEWANITISRLSGILGDRRPNVWSISVTEQETRALHKILILGRAIRVGNLLQDPRAREQRLPSVALLLKRGNKVLLMPTDDIAIKPDDQLLYCGLPVAERSMRWMLNDLHSLNYVMTYEDEPDSFIWRKLHLLMKKNERRSQPRKERRRRRHEQS